MARMQRLEEVTKRGRFVTLDDGTTLEVRPCDQHESTHWHPHDMVDVKPSGDDCWPLELGLGDVWVMAVELDEHGRPDYDTYAPDPGGGLF